MFIFFGEKSLKSWVLLSVVLTSYTASIWVFLANLRVFLATNIFSNIVDMTEIFCLPGLGHCQPAPSLQEGEDLRVLVGWKN